MAWRIFYVDDQEDIVWSTTKLLARKIPELVIEGFTNPVKALAALEKDPPDILVTDLRMEEMSGLELLVAVRKIVPDLPVIFVTAYGGPRLTAALHGRSLVEYLEKPVRADQLIATIDRLLAHGSGFSGAISLPMLPDLIQVYTLSQTTGALSIRRGDSSGTIWFDSGRIVHAICGELFGEPAVYQLLSWQGGEFSLATDSKATERTIMASWQEVLLEGCRRLDEEGRDSAFTDDLEEANEEVALTQVAVPADFVPRHAMPDQGVSEQNGNPRQPGQEIIAELHNSEIDSSEIDRNRTVGSKQQEENSEMASEKEVVAVLEKIREEIPGFIGASLVDLDSGMTLAVNSARPDFDLAAASAFNSEIIKQKKKTIKALNLDSTLEDILLTLSDQLHIIKMVGSGSFIYLAADRSLSNLAIIRSAVARHTSGLT